jgi:hypothetical protein
MTAKTYQLDFNGYWLEQHAGGLPAESGIYAVYAGLYNSQTDTVTLNRLLYLGEAADMCNRVSGHERRPAWKRQLRAGEVLCFSAALIGPIADRQRAEAAMIFKHKPVCNTEYVDSFPFETTTIGTGGRNALMHASFTVTRVEKVVGAFGRRW